MPHDTAPMTDRSMQLIVGRLLRLGVAVAAGVTLAGTGLYLARHGGQAADYAVFVRQPAETSRVAGIVREVMSMRGTGMIFLGLLLLIATPVARVAFSVVGFALERDRTYVVVTLIVLAILLFSLLGMTL